MSLIINLNSRIINPAPATRQPKFAVAVVEAGASPYTCGVLDAEDKHAFCPEQYFIWDGDMLEYTEGYEEVNGESEITAAFKRERMEREPAIEDDHDFIRWGGAGGIG